MTDNRQEAFFKWVDSLKPGYYHRFVVGPEKWEDMRSRLDEAISLDPLCGLEYQTLPDGGWVRMVDLDFSTKISAPLLAQMQQSPFWAMRPSLLFLSRAQD